MVQYAIRIREADSSHVVTDPPILVVNPGDLVEFANTMKGNANIVFPFNLGALFEDVGGYESDDILRAGNIAEVDRSPERLGDLGALHLGRIKEHSSGGEVPFLSFDDEISIVALPGGSRTPSVWFKVAGDPPPENEEQVTWFEYVVPARTRDHLGNDRFGFSSGASTSKIGVRRGRS